MTTENELAKLPDGEDKDKMFELLYEARERGFLYKPAAIYHHHNYRGGLDIHTAEVIMFTLRLNELTDSLFSIEECALVALVHDFGKLWVYDINDDGGISVDKSLLCSEEALAIRLCGEAGVTLSDEAMSAIEFAHGGWSVQVHGHAKPGRLAMLLHSADLLSANFGETERKRKA